MRVLDGVNARSFCWFWVWILFQGSTGLDSRMGACLWDLCLDKYTGDGRFDGETFLGRLLILFLGGRGRGRGSVRSSTDESFSQDDALFQTVPFFMLYIIY